jgi:hypothetical protein
MMKNYFKDNHKCKEFLRPKTFDGKGEHRQGSKPNGNSTKELGIHHVRHATEDHAATTKQITHSSSPLLSPLLLLPFTLILFTGRLFYPRYPIQYLHSKKKGW